MTRFAFPQEEFHGTDCGCVREIDSALDAIAVTNMIPIEIWCTPRARYGIEKAILETIGSVVKFHSYQLSNSLSGGFVSGYKEARHGKTLTVKVDSTISQGFVIDASDTGIKIEDIVVTPQCQEKEPAPLGGRRIYFEK